MNEFGMNAIDESDVAAVEHAAGVDSDDLEETEVDSDASDGSDDSADVLVLDEVDDPELVLPMWEPTGEPRVDAALDSLSALDNAEVADHAAVFTEVHGGLRQVLADLDSDRL